MPSGPSYVMHLQLLTVHFLDSRICHDLLSLRRLFVTQAPDTIQPVQGCCPSPGCFITLFQESSVCRLAVTKK